MTNTAQKVFGIAGWKNSGKTTLTAGLIRHFSTHGWTVSSVKHAHHEFDVDQEGTDSFKHRKSGAKEVLLASAKRFALMHEYADDEDELSLSDLLEKMDAVDLILVEGFKSSDIPKIELRRAATKLDPLTQRIPGIVAIATDNPALASGDDLPILDMNDIPTIADFIVSHLNLSKAEHS